jgi:hypothetical protein
MPIFEFHVSSVISQTNEIYIEKIIKNSKKIEKPSHIVFFCQIPTSLLDKQVLHSFIMPYPRFTLAKRYGRFLGDSGRGDRILLPPAGEGAGRRSLWHLGHGGTVDLGPRRSEGSVPCFEGFIFSF